MQRGNYGMMSVLKAKKEKKKKKEKKNEKAGMKTYSAKEKPNIRF